MDVLKEVGGVQEMRNVSLNRDDVEELVEECRLDLPSWYIVKLMENPLASNILLHILHIHIVGHLVNFLPRQLMTLSWLQIMQRKLFLQLLLPPNFPFTALYGDMTIRQ